MKSLENFNEMYGKFKKKLQKNLKKFEEFLKKFIENDEEIMKNFEIRRNLKKFMENFVWKTLKKFIKNKKKNCGKI